MRNLLNFMLSAASAVPSPELPCQPVPNNYEGNPEYRSSQLMFFAALGLGLFSFFKVAYDLRSPDARRDLGSRRCITSVEILGGLLAFGITGLVVTGNMPDPSTLICYK